MWDAIQLCDTTACGFVFLENVDALRYQPASWQTLFSALAKRGFQVRWVSLSAGNVGSPQRRRRIFLLAVRGKFTFSSFADPFSQEEYGRSLVGQTGIEFNCRGRPAATSWMIDAALYGSCKARLGDARQRSSAIAGLPCCTRALQWASLSSQAFQRAALSPDAGVGLAGQKVKMEPV